MAQQAESRLQRKIRKALESVYPGSFWFKVHGGPFQKAGLPDLIGCVQGQFVALEIKQPGKHPTVLQQRIILRILAADGAATSVTSIDEAIQYVKDIVE